LSEYEDPQLAAPDHEATVEEVKKLMGASAPHFALHIRNRIRKLIAHLPEGHPARVEGEREILRLDRLAFSGEQRGNSMGEPEMPALRHSSEDA